MPDTPTFLDLALKLTEIRTLTGELSEFDDAFLAPRAALEECLPPLLRLALERPEDLGQVRVKVAVIGNFSAGKSTLINAILGRPVCPMKVGESTVGYTRFYYSDREEIYRVTHSDKDNTREILTLDQYTESVAAGGDAGGWFDYGYPFHGLRDIELIDTPGFVGSNPKADKLTEKITKEADVALAVFDINEGEPKRDLLQRLRSIREDSDSQLKRIFLVLNKADAMPDKDERQAIVRVCEKNGLFDDIQVVSARDILESCYFRDLADVGPRLRASIGHVIKQSGGGRWSLEIKLASDRPQQYSLDIGGNGDANTLGGRMMLIKPLAAIQGDKANLLRAQSTRVIQHELTRIQTILGRVRSQCTKASLDNETEVAFDQSKYWNLVDDIKERIQDRLDGILRNCFVYKEIPAGGVVDVIFGNDGSLQLDIHEFQRIHEKLELPLLDFSIELLQRRIVASDFASRDELLGYLRKPFSEEVAKTLRKILSSYENESGSVRRGSTLEWRFNSLQAAVQARNERMAKVILAIPEDLSVFFTTSWGRLFAIAEANDAALLVQKESHISLALKNLEKVDAAMKSSACLLKAHRSQLVNIGD
jgi:small GTP-binding protein